MSQAMNILHAIRQRFRPALERLPLDDVGPFLEMIKPSQDPRFGDYQANCAMPLSKVLKQSPQEIAAMLIGSVELDDLCEKSEVAGPGFINLTLRTDRLASLLHEALLSDRLGVEQTCRPLTFVIDYSAPNVAKPMHVGHIRSTVIGDALAKILRFLGHQVITDNHIGDWGTQFGMIIYGYKHFLQKAAYQENPVAELSRLYQQVNRLVQHHRYLRQIPELQKRQTELEAERETFCKETAEAERSKSQRKQLKRLENQIRDVRAEVENAELQVRAVQDDPTMGPLTAEHPHIERDVLQETAKLHAADRKNRELWDQFMPLALAELNRIYQRLDISFDHTLGESFYQEQLAPLVSDLKERGIAEESDGAVCIFSDDHDVPMIVQKKDGAFLYATTDLATINYRIGTWHPDVILYVVDHRQSLHFEQLFSAITKMDWGPVKLCHIKFGTVLGEDGRPFKTRSGSTVGLESLLDEAVRRAALVAEENNAESDESANRSIAEVIGIGALKYADLSQNRESDYVFSYDKMLALNGNTATYLQYAYARIRSILRKADIDLSALQNSQTVIGMEHSAERQLGLAILRFAEALTLVEADYRPNHLTHYLFEELAKSFSHFFEQCPVLKAETSDVREQRILLCTLTAKTLKTGLSLLGIDVVEKM